MTAKKPAKKRAKQPSGAEVRRNRKSGSPKREALTAEQLRFLTYYSVSQKIKESALKAEVNPGTARDWISKPVFQKELARIRESIQEETKYGLEQAVEEAEEAAVFSMATRNANALVKARELKAKLHGLLIEKHDHRVMSNFKIEIDGVRDVKTLPASVPLLPVLQETPEFSKEELDLL